MEKLMAKKKGDSEEMDPMYKNSKMSMLQALRDEMSGMMKDDLHPDNMKKVTVAGDSPDAVKMGLEKAKDMLGGDEDSEEDSDSSTPEDGDSEGCEAAIGKYLEDPSKENIEHLISMLEKEKSELSDYSHGY